MSRATALRKECLRYAASVDPAVMTGPDAAAAVQDLATAEKALATSRMFLALRVARSDAWKGGGHKSAADWLAGQCGISVWEANKQLGTAKKAEDLPNTKKAMKRGDLSPDQAGAVADAASADPDAEADLLDSAANDTTSALKDKAAKARAAATDAATRERRIRSQRSLRRFTDRDSAFNLNLRGPAMDGVRIEEQLRAREEAIFRDGRRAGLRDTFENRAYDAFLDWLGIPNSDPDAPPTPAPAASPPSPGPDPHAASSPTAPDAPADADPRSAASDAAGARRASPLDQAAPESPSPTSPPGAGRTLPGGNNVKVIVRIDHTALARGHTIAGETCDVAGLGPISVDAAKALMADAFLAAVITKGRDVINVAHLGRGLNAHQRTAIEMMGLRCSNIACNRTIAIEIDHRVPYAADPITELANADPHCPDCHRLKTHHGHHLEAGRGRRRFLPPGHPDNPLTAPPRRAPTSGRAGPPAPTPRPTSARSAATAERDGADPVGATDPRFEQPSLC